MSSSVEQIKEKLGIEEVVGSYVKLERAGNNLKAKCPFHNEKTPSFFVSPDRASFYCFGCGAKGDIFTFVQEFEGVDFLGALKILADRAGVKLEKIGGNKFKNDKKERLYLLLESAAIFFQNNLAEEEIPSEYLKERGLTEKTVKNWRIGYVKDEWRSSFDYLKNKGFTEEEMISAGMIKREGQNTYDRFRGRIMFPIFDSAGRTVAFSGRILRGDDQSAKYLNSPQTEIFDKSKILYGFDRAKQSIRKFDFSILVEGQMDLILCHQAGYTNTVAASGTALTENHLKLLKRISNRIIMAFDSDEAGAKAAERSWMLALSAGMEVKIAAIPVGFDPADLVKKDPEEFKKVLKNSVHLIDFLLGRIVGKITDKKKLWTAVKTNVLPYVSLLDSSTEKSQYVSKLADILDTKEDFIWDDLKKVKIDEEFKNSEENIFLEREMEKKYLKAGSALRNLAVVLAKTGDENLKEKIKDVIGKEEWNKFEKEYEVEKNELAFEAESYYGEKKMDGEIEYLMLNLKEENFKKELASLLSDLKKAEKNKDIGKATAILSRCNEVSKKISEIIKEKNIFLKIKKN